MDEKVSIRIAFFIDHTHLCCSFHADQATIHSIEETEKTLGNRRFTRKNMSLKMIQMKFEQEIIIKMIKVFSKYYTMLNILNKNHEKLRRKF